MIEITGGTRKVSEMEILQKKYKEKLDSLHWESHLALPRSVWYSGVNGNLGQSNPSTHSMLGGVGWALNYAKHEPSSWFRSFAPTVYHFEARNVQRLAKWLHSVGHTEKKGQRDCAFSREYAFTFKANPSAWQSRICNMTSSVKTNWKLLFPSGSKAVTFCFVFIFSHADNSFNIDY